MPDWRAETRRAAQRHGLDPSVFERQIKQESGFAEDVITGRRRSGAGALGIAQIMPATARGWGVDPLNPRAALDAAAANMAKYVRQYGSYRDALVAYNAGPGRVGGALPAETQNYIKVILGGHEPRAPNRTSTASQSGGARTSTTTTTPGVDNSQARASLISSFLGSKSADPVDFALQFRGLADVPGSSSTVTSGGGGGASPSVGGGGLAQAAKQRADAINAQRLPYSWGGGHAGKTALHDAVPLDCSGAVSKVLGIDPRVAADFTRWGRPGDGGGKGVTIAANAGHVLMKINGHWFGTSRSNPGGGAGWIPDSQMSPEYLSNFTLRHSNR